MAKYAIGDVVTKDNKSNVVVRAIFTTIEGHLRFAVENRQFRTTMVRFDVPLRPPRPLSVPFWPEPSKAHPAYSRTGP
jgi:hypothetical protein